MGVPRSFGGLPGQGEAVPGHHHVQHQQVEAAGAVGLPALLPIGAVGHVAALGHEVLGQKAAEVGSSSTSRSLIGADMMEGKVMWKVLPRPGSLSSRIRPPCFRTTART